jgi:hypothetical protein
MATNEVLFPINASSGFWSVLGGLPGESDMIALCFGQLFCFCLATSAFASATLDVLGKCRCKFFGLRSKSNSKYSKAIKRRPRKKRLSMQEAKETYFEALRDTASDN